MNIENPIRDFWERFGSDLDSSARSVIQSFRVWTWSPQLWSQGVSVSKKIAKIEPDGDQVFKSELIRVMRDVQNKRFNSAKEFNNVVKHIQLRHQLRQQQQEKLKRNLTDSKILKINSNIIMERDMSKYQISKMTTMILENRREDKDTRIPEDKDTRIPKDKSVGWAATKGAIGGTIAGGIAQRMRRKGIRARLANTAKDGSEAKRLYKAATSGVRSGGHWKKIAAGAGAAALATSAYLHNRRNRKLRDKKIEASFQNKTN